MLRNTRDVEELLAHLRAHVLVVLVSASETLIKAQTIRERQPCPGLDELLKHRSWRTLERDLEGARRWILKNAPAFRELAAAISLDAGERERAAALLLPAGGEGSL